MLLYGMSMLYGATGSLDIAQVRRGDRGIMQGKGIVLVLRPVFIVVGIGVQVRCRAVPYVGAGRLPWRTHAVTLFIGSAPKIAAFAMAMRLLAEALGGLHGDWQGMLVILAVLSLAIGNVVAIAQTNLKRMLAYSTISHVGFLLLGILPGHAAGLFRRHVLCHHLCADGDRRLRHDHPAEPRRFRGRPAGGLQGPERSQPVVRLHDADPDVLLAGVPPTVGFYAKLAVLQAVINVDLVWLALVAVFFSIIGAFYYIRVVKLMYFDAPETDAPLAINTDLRIAVSLNGLVVFGLGVFPGGLLALCNSVLA